MKTRIDRLNKEQEQTFNKSFRVIKRILNQLDNHENGYSYEYIELQELKILKHTRIIFELLKDSTDLNKETLRLLTRVNKRGFIYAIDCPRQFWDIFGLTQEQYLKQLEHSISIRVMKDLKEQEEISYKLLNKRKKQREKYLKDYYRSEQYKEKNKLRIRELRANQTQEQREKENEAKRLRMKELRDLRKKYKQILKEELITKVNNETNFKIEELNKDIKYLELAHDKLNTEKQKENNKTRIENKYKRIQLIKNKAAEKIQEIKKGKHWEAKKQFEKINKTSIKDLRWFTRSK